MPKEDEGDAVAIAVALADKLDTLVGFWAIGEKPTGSGDPYQLRRAALGVIRIVLENDLRVPLVRITRDHLLHFPLVRGEPGLRRSPTASVLRFRSSLRLCHHKGRWACR